MPVAHGYIRVSTKDQEDSGLGLEAYREQVLRAFEYKWKPLGFEYGRTYEDAAVSGGKPLTSRKAGGRLGLALNSGDVAIFPKLDRGFRNTEDMLTTVRVWAERGVRCHFLDIECDSGTAIGRCMLTVGAAFAQLERERGGERTREALAAAKRKGKHVGRLSFGLRAVGPAGNRRYEVVPEIYVVAKEILSWKLKGHTWEMIELHLRKNGITRPGPKGSKLQRKWSVWACRAAYVSILKILAWLDQGKVHLPKGVPR